MNKLSLKPKKETIIVNTRNEFKKLFVKLFIPKCIKDGDTETWNFGYALNNWEFFSISSDSYSLIVELKIK